MKPQVSKTKNWEVHKMKGGQMKLHKRFHTRGEAWDRMRIMRAEGHECVTKQRVKTPAA